MSEPGDEDYLDEDEEEFDDLPEKNASMLERARYLRSKLNASDKKEIESLYSEFFYLWDLLLTLNDGRPNGHGAGPELARSLSTNISLLNKFVNQKKPVRMRDARMIADRLVTHLQSIDPEDSTSATRTAPPSPAPRPLLSLLRLL